MLKRNRMKLYFYVVALLSVCSLLGVTHTQGGPAKENTMNLAFVLLPKTRLPKAEEIAKAFDHFATSKEQKLLPRGSQSSAKDNTEILVFELKPRGDAFVALMPTPVPNGEAADATRFSLSAVGTGWKLPKHQAHAIVTLKDANTASMVDTLSLFTSLLAAVTEASEAVGVYWGEAGATHDPKFFLDTAEDHDVSSRIMLWTGVSVAHEKDGRLSLLSTGMKQLNLPDLLLIAPKSAGNAALGTFYDFLSYSAEFGKPLPEGDTIGRTADERLPIHYVTSPIDPKVKVWRVELK
jgi:hypothetical protein